MASAQKALAENGTRRKELRAERDQADANLRLLMRGVISEIRVRLSKDSPLWGSFGLSAQKARKRKAKADAETPQTTATSSVVNMAASIVRPAFAGCGTGGTPALPSLRQVRRHKGTADDLRQLRLWTWANRHPRFAFFRFSGGI